MQIYSTIREKFEKDLKYTCERFSNNDNQDLTVEEKLFTIKQIHRFANDYLRSWFPNQLFLLHNLN